MTWISIIFSVVSAILEFSIKVILIIFLIELIFLIKDLKLYIKSKKEK